MKKRSFSQNLIQNSSTTRHPNVIYTSRSSVVNSSKKRKTKELSLGTNNSYGKYFQYLNTNYILIFLIYLIGKFVKTEHDSSSEHNS